MTTTVWMILMKYEFLIQKSKKLNREINSKSKQFRHFSFILYGNKIISIGQNDKDKTHTLAFKNGYKYSCIHSELDALVRAKISPEKFKKCVLVNIRLNRFNHVNLSRPCQNCQSLIKKYNFGNNYSNLFFSYRSYNQIFLRTRFLDSSVIFLR
jgi:hypothetical protein